MAGATQSQFSISYGQSDDLAENGEVTLIYEQDGPPSITRTVPVDGRLDEVGDAVTTERIDLIAGTSGFVRLVRTSQNTMRIVFRIYSDFVYDEATDNGMGYGYGYTRPGDRWYERY